MVKPLIWDKLMIIAREHATFGTPDFRCAEISRSTNVADDMGLQGELAIDFLMDIKKNFSDFEFDELRGDFFFDKYFRSQVSQVFGSSWLYIFFRGLKDKDKEEKLPLTLGMLEDAISRGYWEEKKYRKWKNVHSK